jgi:DNA-binding IclR family transcriptional regulator
VTDGQESKDYLVPAVVGATRILRYLARRQHTHAGLSQIAADLEINKSTCLRILRTLESQGFVHHDPQSRNYSLGTYLFVLGERAAEESDVLTVALPHLRRAAQLTELTCVLAQRYGRRHHLYVAKAEAESPIRISVTVGQRFPVTAGSHGKVLLAFMDRAEALRVIRHAGLPEFTPHAITDPEEYAAALDEVREHGYAISLEQHYLGISGVSAPILDATGQAVLALSAIGTSAELLPEHAVTVAEQLRALTEVASARLGSHSPLGGGPPAQAERV